MGMNAWFGNGKRETFPFSTLLQSDFGGFGKRTRFTTDKSRLRSRCSFGEWLLGFTSNVNCIINLSVAIRSGIYSLEGVDLVSFWNLLNLASGNARDHWNGIMKGFARWDQINHAAKLSRFAATKSPNFADCGKPHWTEIMSLFAIVHVFC